MSEEKKIPIIYEENKIKVLEDLKDGRLDYLDLADWTFQDKFFAFLLGIRFFEICGASYPTPRKKEDVPLWFLLGGCPRTQVLQIFTKLNVMISSTYKPENE